MGIDRLSNIDYKKLSITRDTIQLYAQLLSVIKGKFVPHQKNWEEYSLNFYAKGFTTSPIPIVTDTGIEALDLNLNFVENKLKIFYKNHRDQIDLHQNSIQEFTNKLISILSSYQIEIGDFDNKFLEKNKTEYIDEAATSIWDLYRNVYFILQEFRHKTSFESSSLNFWSHHFDISVLIFSGKIIPNQNVNNWSNSREQMNFGFSLGDSEINEPYFYVTAYPFSENLLDLKIPNFASWKTERLTGLIIRLSELKNENNINQSLIDLFNNILEENYKKE